MFLWGKDLYILELQYRLVNVELSQGIVRKKNFFSAFSDLIELT
jgi:hypothetical protein